MTPEDRAVDGDALEEPPWHAPGTPPARCPDCGRPFSNLDRQSLHRGLVHPDALTDAEWAAYERARAAERRALRRYKLVSVAAVTTAYFAFLFAYAIFA